jgi:hypothetical protein
MEGLLQHKISDISTNLLTTEDNAPSVIKVITNSEINAKKLDFSKKISGLVISKVMEHIKTKGLTLENVDELMEQTYRLFSETIKELDQEIEESQTLG